MAKLKLHCFVKEGRDYIGFLQILKEWERLGFVELMPKPPDPSSKRFMKHIFTCWVGRVGGLALEPTPTRITHTNDPFEHAMVVEYFEKIRNIPNTHAWNFWVRDLSSYEKVRKDLSNIDKTVESVFSGTIRKGHPVRHKWIDSTEVFSWRVARRYTRVNRLKSTSEGYYRLLASSKYGLCPHGDTGFCQKEIETIGMGTVPIFTPLVEYCYHEPLIEDVHFIYAETPEEMHKKIAETSEEKRKWMVNNGDEYYERRLSPTGMWNSVLETIDKYNIEVD